MHLTTEKPKGAPVAAGGKFLTLTLGRELYALSVMNVREIIRPLEISPVPRAPAHVLGVVNLRGKIVPILDLRIRFGLEFTGRTERTCIVVVQTGQGSFLRLTGLMVDEVQEVLTLAAGEIEEPPNFGTAIDTACIRGLAKVKGAVMILLDLESLLAAQTTSPR